VALYHRARTGQGQLVDASLLATGVVFMQALLAEQSVLGVERPQQGNAGFHAAPADTYRTRDGWIVVSVIGPEMFARWARLVGREYMLADPRFSDDLSRANHREPIADAMNAWLATRTTAQAVAEFEQARIPAGPVLDVAQVLADPQVKARELLKYVECPGAPRPVPVAETAMRLSATPGGIRHRAPMLGEHTDVILDELGYSTEEIASLHAAEVV
jgi:crotonobetainyl-CoA:carnitine CoA-transferase CaiB-like acyl-CoA transferase